MTTRDVTAWSEFRPRGALRRLIGPVVRRKFHRAQRSVLAALKAAIETEHAQLNGEHTRLGSDHELVPKGIPIEPDLA